jgi:uncharacterized protein YgbK (DUF1537 family)
MDAVMAQLRETVTIVVPSFPAAGRTVYQGRLFVGDQPLDESPMRDHPLTPMRDSSLLRLLAQQSTASVQLVPLHTVRRGPEILRAEVERISADETGTIALVIDAIDETDLATIMQGTSDLRVVTGGSGLAQGLPATETVGVRSIPHTPGLRAVLCGSASARTREQVQIAKPQLPWRKLTVSALRRDVAAEANAVIEWAKDVWQLDPGAVPLVFSVESLEDVKAGTSNVPNSESDSDLVEKALGLIAKGFVGAGVRELVVAGGESSGRVVHDLGIAALKIGPEIDTGVAWSAGTTSDGVPITIALKSGNFGQPNMFAGAWDSISPGGVLAEGAAS